MLDGKDLKYYLDLTEGFESSFNDFSETPLILILDS